MYLINVNILCKLTVDDNNLDNEASVNKYTSQKEVQNARRKIEKWKYTSNSKSKHRDGEILKDWCINIQ